MCPNGGKTNFRSLYFRSGVNLRPEVLSAEDFRPLYFRPSSREKYVIGHPRGRPGRKSSKLVYYRSRVYKILSETFRADIDNFPESFYTNTPLFTGLFTSLVRQKFGKLYDVYIGMFNVTN